MDDDSTFRFALIIGFVAVVLITLHHRIRSRASREQLDRRQEGRFPLAGVGILAAAVGLLTWTLRSLGANLTDTVVTRRVHTLVTHGPYRWVRHPFYGAMALLILAIALVAANWFFLLAGGLVVSLITVRTAIEERHLLARFGEEYQAYLSRTGRFVPRLSARRGAPRGA